jgi:hypothetical protein
MERSHTRDVFVFGQRFDPQDVFEQMDFEVYQSLTEEQKHAIVEALETTLLNYYAMSAVLPEEAEPAGPAPQGRHAPAQATDQPVERLQQAISGGEPRRRNVNIQEARRRRLRGTGR